MSYYKDLNNDLHFLSEEDIKNGGEKFLPEGSVRISDSDALQMQQDYIVTKQEEVVNEIDPKDKLKAFLQANPDVVAIL